MSKMQPDFRSFFRCFWGVSVCFLLSFVYLASLHVWNSPYHRDHPSTIKRRFISVFFMLFISPCFLYFGLHPSVLQQSSLLEILGLRTPGLLQATLLPLFLTMILFLGPITMKIMNIGNVAEDWLDNCQNLIWLRNHLVAPFSEEFTYRSCMLPLLLQCLNPVTAVLINPLFFGVAHFHHMQERVKFGLDFRTALKISCFQFAYTTLFGAYSAYLFYRTGHFMAIFLVHAFCNHMGFPDLIEITTYKTSRKILTITLFFLGFAAFCKLLNPLTQPRWYSNSPTWYSV